MSMSRALYAVGTFGDYPYYVRPAKDSEIEDWKGTAQRMGWAIPEDFSRAEVGSFLAHDQDYNELPYELRSTVMSVSGDVRYFLSCHFDELAERVIQDIHNAL